MRYLTILFLFCFLSCSIFAQFGNPKKIKIGAFNHACRQAVSGDIDGDGIDDALFVPYEVEGESVVYRKGIVNYPYFEATENFVTDDFGRVLLADFDGDGDSDIFLYAQERLEGTEGLLKMFLNDGNGNFDTEIVLDDLGGSGGRFAECGDIDDDGDMDIVYTVLDAPNDDFPSGTVWLENDGTGNFDSRVIGLSQAYAIALADITGDSFTDIIISELFDDRLTIYENDENNGFQYLIKQKVKEFPSEIHTGDFNGDQLLDVVVVATSGDRFITYYENDGSSNYSFIKTTVSKKGIVPSTNAEVADFDGDGDLDIIWSGLGIQMIGWFANDGNGNFTEQGILLLGQKTYVIDLVDVNGDGFPDLFSHSASNGFPGIAINDGNSGLDFVRYNASEKLDIPAYAKAVQNDEDATSELLVVNKEGGFVQIIDNVENEPVDLNQVYYDEFSQPFQGEVFDADGDSDTDILILYQEGLVLFNRENGAYSTQVLPNSDVADYFEVYDFNNDGVNDVVASSSLNQKIYVWYSEDGQYISRSLVTDDLSGSTNFTVVSNTSGSLMEGLVYTDNNGNVVNLPYTGTGSFGLPTTLKTTDFDFRLFGVADLDGDEMDDLIVASDIGIFRLMNAGTGELEDAALVDFEEEISDFLIKDISNDGLVDLVSYRRGENDLIKIYENQGSGLFFLEDQYTNSGLQSVAVGDFDGDGDNDLIAAESIKNRAFLLKNNNPVLIPFSGIAESGGSSSQDAISVYPNPTSQFFRISDLQAFEDDLIHVSIFDVQGKVVFQDQNVSKYDETNIGVLPQGIYTIMLTETDSKINHYAKLVKK